MENTNPRRSEDRNYQWRQISDKRAMERERSSHTSAFRAAQRNNSQPPRFEIPQTTDPSARVGRLPSPPILPRIDREESSASKGGHVSTDRGIPLRLPIDDLPTDAMEEALGEVRGFMNQYASVADPTESAARMERYRQAEELGEFEETAAHMVRAKLASQATPPMERTATPSPKRTSAILRLGPPPPLSKGTSPPDQTAPRRKPGRPPGSKRTVHSSPKLLAGSTSRKRKVQQTKPPTCRRKLTPANTPSAVPRGQKNRPTNSRDSSNRRGSINGLDNLDLNLGLNIYFLIRRWLVAGHKNYALSSKENELAIVPGLLLDNTIARHGIHGLYWLHSVNAPASSLGPECNTIYLTQPLVMSPLQGLMYDYIRQEYPDSVNHITRP
ncbi:hypothetical protein HID58_024649 [Brassica napus]|uniref:Rhamnogalacturonan lyase domain-containing protein n=1 Tax=Brassica napus TaxID=3708 RepID=A0ABQ8CIS4_BRANA|nr:hypothetical protein HID58_024649 [Brassica napus]